MSAITFPSSPHVNDYFTVNGRTWIWTGSVWNIVTTYSTPTPIVTGAVAPHPFAMIG